MKVKRSRYDAARYAALPKDKKHKRNNSEAHARWREEYKKKTQTPGWRLRTRLIKHARAEAKERGTSINAVLTLWGIERGGSRLDKVYPRPAYKKKPLPQNWADDQF